MVTLKWPLVTYCLAFSGHRAEFSMDKSKKVKPLSIHKGHINTWSIFNIHPISLTGDDWIRSSGVNPNGNNPIIQTDPTMLNAAWGIVADLSCLRTKWDKRKNIWICFAKNFFVLVKIFVWIRYLQKIISSSISECPTHHTVLSFRNFSKATVKSSIKWLELPL